MSETTTRPAVGYRRGKLEAAIETWLYRYEHGFVSEIADAVGSHPDSVRQALHRLGAVSDGSLPASWSLSPKGKRP